MHKTQACTADGSIWSNLHSVYKAPFSLPWHTRAWQNAQGKTDWSYRVQKGFARLSEAVPHHTEGYQCVQGYIKGSTSSCYSFGGSCKLAKHLALVTGVGHCQADQRLELYKGHTSVVLQKAF